MHNQGVLYTHYKSKHVLYAVIGWLFLSIACAWTVGWPGLQYCTLEQSVLYSRSWDDPFTTTSADACTDSGRLS